MLRRVTCAIMALFMVGIGATTGASAAYAQDNCNTTIVDHANVFHNLGAIQAAADNLQDLGANVKVRTIESYGGEGSLDYYIDDTWADCSSWQNFWGDDFSSNLLVFAMSLEDRDAGIYYGSDWQLNGNAYDIQDNIMGPAFANGNFDDGFVDAMQETAHLLSGRNVSQPHGGDTASQVNILPVLQWLLLVAVTASAVFGAIVFFQRRKRAKNELATAHQEAQEAHVSANKAVSDLMSNTHLAELKLAVATYGSLADERVREMQLLLEAFKTHSHNATTTFANAEIVTPGQTLAHYLSLASTYNQVTEAAKAAQAARDELLEIDTQIKAELNNLPEMVKRTATELTHAESVIARGATAFDRIIASGHPESAWQSVEGNVAEATTRAEMAAQLLQDVRETLASTDDPTRLKALADIRETNTLAREARSIVQSVIKLEGHLKWARDQAPKEVRTAAGVIEEAADFIRTHADDVSDTAAPELNIARIALNAARTELAKSSPNYVRALELALDANRAADRVYNQAVSQHEAAEHRRARAVTALEQAEGTVSETREYLQDHQEDVSRQTHSTQEKAERYLADARHATTPASQEDAANSTTAAAREALRLAKRDFKIAEASRRQPRPRPQAGLTGLGIGFAASPPAQPRPTSQRGQARQWGAPAARPQRRSGGGSSTRSRPRKPPKPGSGGRGGGSSRW